MTTTPQPTGGDPQYHATAQHAAGDSAAIAYSVQRADRGPSGEAFQTFVVCTRDRGATWTPVPLVRTIASHFRYWGFPVWPPESVDAIDGADGALSLRFRDEWVMFEPGGESLWSGTRGRGGLWTVTRVRLMDYDRADRGNTGSAPAIEVSLPPGFAPPPSPLLDAVASRIARDTPSRALDKYGWLIAIPAGSSFAIWGASWRSVVATIVILAVLPITTILVARRRRRRANAGA